MITQKVYISLGVQTWLSFYLNLAFVFFNSGKEDISWLNTEILFRTFKNTWDELQL